MSANKYTWHIQVLPEDDANRQIANGFVLNVVNERAIQILKPVGGWGKVIEAFENVHIHEMQKYQFRRIVLIIDFDNDYIERLNLIKNKIPDELSDRVFILGVLSEPEDLKRKLRKELNGKGFEGIGESLSQDCSNDTKKIWGHSLLKHNEAELDRMVDLVKPSLFDKA